MNTVTAVAVGVLTVALSVLLYVMRQLYRIARGVLRDPDSERLFDGK